MPAGLIPFGGNWVALGATALTGSAVSTAVLDFPAMDMLHVSFQVTGYSGGGDIAAFRFNSDSGGNYWDRHLICAAGATTFTNVVNVSTTLLRVAGFATTLQRSGWIHIMNNRTTSKVAMISNLTGTGAAATSATLEPVGGGEWVNTTAQITQMQMLTAGGAVTMPAGTGFSVYGCNLT